MTGADAYLRAMCEESEYTGVPVDWPAVDRIIDGEAAAFRHSAHQNNVSVIRPRVIVVQETIPMSVNHPLQAEISIAQDMILRIEETARELADAISTEKYAKQAAADARSTLAGAEAEIVTEAVVLSIAGEGPLANIAKTSKAYDAALDALRQRAYRNGLGGLMEAANRRQSDALKASIALEQAQIRFSALRHASELQAAILRAALL